MGRMRPPFKTHGGKSYLSQWIISHFPDGYDDMLYVEPYCGAGNVLLNKKPSIEETINDLDEGIYQILRCLRDQSDVFVSYLSKTRYTKKSFETAYKKTEFQSNLDFAINEFILRRMSRGGLKLAFAWSTRQRGGKPGDRNAWNTIMKILPIISKRLEKVYIFNKPALEIIDTFNYTNALIYVDPPYLPTTRECTSVYKHEMTQDDHIDLADMLKVFKGKVILSGYPSALYNRLYKDWIVVKKHIHNHASQQKKKNLKIECLWKNY